MLLSANKDVRTLQVSLDCEEAQGVALALDRFGCRVIRATLGGKLYLTPPMYCFSA